MSKLEINIGLFGCVSVGKSTFLNAMAGHHYSDVEIKKTTMVPQVYIEDVCDIVDCQKIREKNRETNDNITKLLESKTFTEDKCEPLYHKINRICDLFNPDIINSNIKINLYDIPGLNDSSSKTIYFDWVQKNIKLFNIIIFMTDITRGLNSSDEHEVLNLLMDSMSKYNNKMICLMNKCDDIYYDINLDDLVFEEKEQENIYVHANTTLADMAKSHGFQLNDKNITPFLPISSENCFIYRALMNNPLCVLDKKHQIRLCKNECGPNQWKKMTSEEKKAMFKQISQDLKYTYESRILDTGYFAVKTVIQQTIIMNEKNFVISGIDESIKILKAMTLDNVSEYVRVVRNHADKLAYCGDEEKYDVLWTIVQKSVVKYVRSVKTANAEIINNRYYFNFENFETVHSNIQICCMNLTHLIEDIADIYDFDEKFFLNKREKMINKLLMIYDKLCYNDCKMSPKSITHSPKESSFDFLIGSYWGTTTITTHESIREKSLRPINIYQYLLTINIYAPTKFESYAKKFLKILSKIPYSNLIEHISELSELLIYISKYISQPTSSGTHNDFLILIIHILINKQKYLQYNSTKEYFPYLILLKKLVKKLISEQYTPIDILYQIITKNISLYLNMHSMTNIYRQDIDTTKINNLLNNFNNTPISLTFEENILSAYTNKKN